MKNNPLIELLNMLDKREMTRFRDYVHSPYFNKHRDVQALVTYLHKVFPQFDEDRCDRRRIFKELFGKEVFDQSRLALVFTYANRLLDQFLAQEQYRQEGHVESQLLLKWLRQRKYYPRYEKSLRDAHRRQEQDASRGPDFFYRQFLLASEADMYYGLTTEASAEQSLQVKEAGLDSFYLAEKLKDACEMLVRRRIERKAYHTPMLSAVLHEIKQHPDVYAQAPPVLIYYQVYRLLSEATFENYNEALRCFQHYIAQLPEEELKTVYNYLQNHCIGQINKGDERFLVEIFHLYQAQLEQGLLIEDGFLSEWHYKNIVTAGLRLREMDWVHRFINEYRDRLPLEAQANAYRFNLASYHYATGDYNKVLDLLIQVEYSDLRYSLGAKALLLRTYYDLEEYEALRALATSFRLYLQRHKLMADFRREGYHNLFRFTRRAAQLKSNLPFYAVDKSRRELDKLRQDISRAGAIFNKSWLLEKVEDLGAAVEAEIGSY